MGNIFKEVNNFFGIGEGRKERINQQVKDAESGKGNSTNLAGGKSSKKKKKPAPANKTSGKQAMSKKKAQQYNADKKKLDSMTKAQIEAIRKKAKKQ